MVAEHEGQETMAPLVVDNVIKTFRQGDRDVTALGGVSLSIERGRFLAIMGASGSGKSTLLHLMAGLTKADSGRVSVANQDLGELNDRQLTLFRRKHIGLVFQAFNLIPTLSAETRFPLGLFRAWTVWRPAARLLVYPQPEPAAPRPPAARHVPGGPTTSRSLDGDEVEGVRGYRRGDPPKRIAWKKAAQALEAGGELVSRDTSASAHQELWLDWAACTGLEPELRLSRLTAWIHEATTAGR